uniref:DUF4149 domain-containing protein n=1 Tax=Rhabditophanes sp. KR3021 TaxID=114890 RepID=A0AC35U728_9BILA
MSKYVNVPGSFQSNPADYKDNTSHSKEHSSSPTNANFSQPNLWSRAWVDYYLVLQIGVSSFAIFSLYLYSLAPKYKQPHLIIPNIVALAVGTVANLLGFSVFLALIVRIPRNRRFIHSVEHFIAYQMALVLFSCIIHLICLSKAYQTYSTYFTDSETLT